MTIKLPRAYSTITPLDREYLMQSLIPYGTVTGLFGGEGIGKGFLEEYLACVISNGGTFPGGDKVDQGSVILVTPEDDSNVTVVKRLMACGANGAYVYDMTTIDGAPFTIPGSIPRLREVIGQLGNVRLAILDPLGDLSSIGLTSSVVKVRQTILNPLISLAEDTGIALLLTMHTNKDGKKMQGSSAIRQALRQVLRVDELKSNPAIRSLRLEKSDAVDIAKAPVWHYTIKAAGASAKAVFTTGDSDTAEDVEWHDYSDDELAAGWTREAGQSGILQTLDDAYPQALRAGDISARVGLKYIAARVLLMKLKRHGDVIQTPSGDWTLPEDKKS